MILKYSKLLTVAAAGGIIVLSYSLIFSCTTNESTNEEWQVPGDALNLKNPFAENAAAFKTGKELFNLYCSTCHGEVGFGDGPARGPLGKRPANLHDDKVTSQSDGALFWKVTAGKNDMPSFEKILSEEQRWQVISYVRRIPEVPDLRFPVALDSGIQIEHYMAIAPKAVRILQNPVNGDLWYTAFDGEVYHIKDTGQGQRISDLVFSKKDHGIEILQGAAFIDNNLFLCGNVYSGDKKSTHGRMVKYNLDATDSNQMTIVFTTVEYGANKTIYDHGWNGMVVSPDKKFIYVNSGARTDHGEIQDNGGAYPNARDNALTAKVFRIPADTKDLLLPDDEAKLKANGYLFATGVRNVYDLNFDAEDNLFGVSNSGDYDYPEDMFWLRQGHHYGFPWVMGGLENPQQYKDWIPDADKNLFINKSSHSWRTNYYYTDTTFPGWPKDVNFSPGIQNFGPDANEYRGHSGKIVDGDHTGVAISTFTAHSSPLGLIFDTKKILSDKYKADGFTLRYSLGERSSLMSPFTHEGADLLHLDLIYVPSIDNYIMHTKRLVAGFREPVDAILIGNAIFVIEYGGRGGNIWKIIMPANIKPGKTVIKEIKSK